MKAAEGGHAPACVRLIELGAEPNKADRVKYDMTASTTVALIGPVARADLILLHSLCTTFDLRLITH